MVQKPLMTQGYSLAEEIANSISHGIGLVFGIVGFGAVVGSGGRGECGYDGYRQLQFIWREHDPAFSCLNALSCHSSSAGKNLVKEI